MQENPASLRSLLPFVVFLGLFLGTGIVLTLQGVDYAFYQLPASIAIIPAIIFAFIVSKQKLNEQISTFISGVGNSNTSHALEGSIQRTAWFSLCSTPQKDNASGVKSTVSERQPSAAKNSPNTCVWAVAITTCENPCGRIRIPSSSS